MGAICLTESDERAGPRAALKSASDERPQLCSSTVQVILLGAVVLYISTQPNPTKLKSARDERPESAVACSSVVQLTHQCHRQHQLQHQHQTKMGWLGASSFFRSSIARLN